MGRGSRRKVRWENDRIRKKKARNKRQAIERRDARKAGKTAGSSSAPASPPPAPAAPPPPPPPPAPAPAAEEAPTES